MEGVPEPTEEREGPIASRAETGEPSAMSPAASLEELADETSDADAKLGDRLYQLAREVAMVEDRCRELYEALSALLESPNDPDARKDAADAIKAEQSLWPDAEGLPSLPF